MSFLLKTLFFLIGLILIATPPAWSKNLTIFILSPEGKTNLTLQAKQSLTHFLHNSNINANVYLFANEKDFHDMHHRQSPDFAIVSSYIYQSYRKKYNWHWLLRGHSHNQFSFQKVLIAQKKFRTMSDLTNQPVATVVIQSPYYQKYFIYQPLGLSKTKIRLISVSKDIDAIMALGFDQVKAAIVTEQSVLLIQQFNPDLKKKLHILTKLPAIEYPKLVVYGTKETSTQIRQIFRQMLLSSPGKAFLQYLQISGFQ